MAKVNFCSCTYAQYKNAVTKGLIDNDTLYFVSPDSDNGKAGIVYKGASNITASVTVIPSDGTFPSEAEAEDGRFYIHEGTFELAYKAGNVLIILSPGYLTDSQEWVEADSGKLATIGLVTKGIRAVVNQMCTEGVITTAGKVQTFSGIVDKVTYNGNDLLLTIGEEGKGINISLAPHLIESGYYDPAYDFGDHVGPAIVLVLDSSVDPPEVIAIPADGLVDVYTAGDGITISSNEISVNIDPASNGALVTTATGLKLNIVQVPSPNNVIRFAVIDKTNNNVLSESEFDISKSTDPSDDNTHIPTTAWVAAAIITALNPLELRIESIEDIVNNFADYTVGTEETYAELAELTPEQRRAKLATEQLVYNTQLTWNGLD